MHLGIPDYWLTALKNTDVFGDIIMVSLCGSCVNTDEHLLQEHDEPILKHLTDIKLLYGDNSGMVGSL